MNNTTIAEYLREWIAIIGAAKDGIKHSDMLQQFYSNHPEISDKDKENIRVAVGHNRTNCSRAGWVHFQEQGSWNTGLWYLTEDGRKALETYHDPLDFMKAASRQRELVENSQEQSCNFSENSVQQSASEDAVQQEIQKDSASRKAEIIFEDAKDAASNGIESFLQSMSCWDFQELVGDLLTAHGYHVDWIAPPGPDGGCDIVAFTDPLGISHPVIKVQVKRQKDKAGVPVVKSFSANLSANDAGIFICLGGFTRDAQIWARDYERNLTLIDLDRFVHLWIANYDKLSDKAKSKFRLEPIYFVRSDSE